MSCMTRIKILKKNLIKFKILISREVGNCVKVWASGLEMLETNQACH